MKHRLAVASFIAGLVFGAYLTVAAFGAIFVGKAMEPQTVSEGE